jgi:glycosyltransferase involved in cell wall biosynthesis
MVSVIIPTHKRADLLFYELERIYSQKNVEIEVVVVNDIEEEDETDRITCLFPQVIYIKSNQVQGPSEKHKKGFAITKGEYVYMPDDDDYLIDDHFFEKAIKIFQQDDSISFVSGNVKIRYEDENHKEISTAHQVLNLSGKIDGFEYLQEFQHNYNKPASTVSTLYRRASIDGNMIEMSDSSIYMESLFNGNAFIIDDIVAGYRVRSIKGKSLTSSASLGFIINVLKQKEQFYMRAIGKLPRPKDFWSYQFSATYGLFAQKQNCNREKITLLVWGIRHSHGSIRLNVFLIKQIVKLFFLV